MAKSNELTTFQLENYLSPVCNDLFPVLFWCVCTVYAFTYDIDVDAFSYGKTNQQWELAHGIICIEANMRIDRLNSLNPTYNEVWHLISHSIYNVNNGFNTLYPIRVLVQARNNKEGETWTLMLKWFQPELNRPKTPFDFM